MELLSLSRYLNKKLVVLKEGNGTILFKSRNQILQVSMSKNVLIFNVIIRIHINNDFGTALQIKRFYKF